VKQRFSIIAAAAALAVTATVTFGSQASAHAPTHAGSAGLGDPFFPLSGNGGYDVKHYGIALSYRPNSGRARARVAVKARALKRLRSFHLDYRGPKITLLQVNGHAAHFRRNGQELIVRPAQPLESGSTFGVIVRYRGVPHYITDPDNTIEGWVRTDDGVFIADEPRAAPTWFPCNDNPNDKADYSFRVTVPRPLVAIANGRLKSVSSKGSHRTYAWQETDPMASYLATIDIGRGILRHGHIGGVGRPGGVPFWTFVDRREADKSAPVLARLPRILHFESRLFGPYPFDAAGAIIDHKAGVDYELETQTRPIFDGSTTTSILVHEQAHQWFGDSVSLRTWPNIWLNEGFATYTEWLWSEAHGGHSARAIFRNLSHRPADSTIWDPPPGRPGEPVNLFAASIYVRGAMALEAVRLKVGKKTLLHILRRWATERRYGNGTIKQFIALSEEVSGRNLQSLFHKWLFEPGKPGSSQRAGNSAAAIHLRR
jgi:aminopeptidase N